MLTGLKMDLHWAANRLEELKDSHLNPILDMLVAFYRIFQETLTNGTRHALAIAMAVAFHSTDGWFIRVRRCGGPCANTPGKTLPGVPERDTPNVYALAAIKRASVATVWFLCDADARLASVRLH
jgi:glucose-6-phosphate-specific signal transduction histidine kinase